MRYIQNHHYLLFIKAGITNFLIAFFVYSTPLDIFLATLVTCGVYALFYVAFYFIKKDFFYWDRFEAAFLEDSIVLILIYVIFIVHIAFNSSQLLAIGIGLAISCIAPIALLAFA